MTTFTELGLSTPILRALAEEGYQTPTPIQQAAIPVVLEGRDVIATAQTGTGKTAAFSLPILECLSAQRPRRGVRVLVLSPTRELALQIADSFRRYGRHLPFKTAVVIGGVSIELQLRTLRNPPEILIATPGRLVDLFNRMQLSLSEVDTFVLDEADRMLDMGFIRDVRRIVAMLPTVRQSLMFSATMSPEVEQLTTSILRAPAKIEVARPATVAGGIEQKVMFVEQASKMLLLTDLLRKGEIKRALVFTRTKHRANRVAQQLAKQGMKAEAIHSNKSQNARQRALAAFDKGNVRVLIATDIMARGIDVDGISHVINFELPNDPDSYVHRIGRTARAGAQGTALSFCASDELPYLADIEKLIKLELLADEDQAYHAPAVARARRLPLRVQPKQASGPSRQGRSSRRRRYRGAANAPRHVQRTAGVAYK